MLVVPALLVKSRRRLETLALLALPLALCYAPYVLTDPRWGLGLLGGLGAYAERWRFNEGGFGLLDLGLQASGASAALARWLWPDPSYDAGQDLNLLQVAAKALAGAIVLGALTWRLRPRFRLEQSAFLAGALFLLLSPVVHPWYALWILPLLPLRSPRLAWLFLSLALPVSYAVLLTYDGTPATWQESPWTRAIEYAPFAALLLVDGLRARAGDPPA
ncbi:MAG: hypothetical protein R3F62_05965 [Planctomycetota bacterium]